jgi:hypothetical protein
LMPVFAAASGNFELLRRLEYMCCSWDLLTTTALAKRGHFEMLKWAHALDCPLILTCSGKSPYSRVCEVAAEGGYLDIVQWARANGCPWDRALVCRLRSPRDRALGVQERRPLGGHGPALRPAAVRRRLLSCSDRDCAASAPEAPPPPPRSTTRSADDTLPRRVAEDAAPQSCARAPSAACRLASSAGSRHADRPSPGVREGPASSLAPSSDREPRGCARRAARTAATR